MIIPMPLEGLHDTYVMFNRDYTVSFITTKNLKNLETIGVLAGDEEMWVYQAIRQDPEILKTLKCFPMRKRMTLEEINNYTEEEFLDYIFTRGE